MAKAAKSEQSARYMPEALRLTGILGGALSIVAAIVFALIAAFAVIHLGNDGRPAPQQAASFRKPPAIEGSVRLQPDPARDIDAFMAEKRRLLEGYAWVDSDHQIARIPIERAMALIARQRGKLKQ